MSVLAERLLAVDAALDRAGLAHAFGGAIALAYCTHEPRGTRDLDVNVFIKPDRADEALDALPDGVSVSKAERAAARRKAQVRVMWEDTPIDLFFDAHDFHREVAESVTRVPFEGATIPVLGCEALIVFKAMFNRTRDWADIEAVLSAGAADCGKVLARLRSLLGPSDAAAHRFAELCR